jgi:hypothetical protein
MNDLDMVRALRADAPGPSGDRLAEGRARLRTAMAHGHRHHHHRQRHTVMVASAAAVAAALAAIVLLPAGRSPAPAGHRAGSRHQSAARLLSVTAVLDNAAAAAQRRPSTLPGPHQWIYEKGVKAASASRFTAESWTMFDGTRSADIERGRLVVLPYGPAGDGVPDATPQGAASFLRALPAKPKALLAVVFRKAQATPRDQWAVPGNIDTEAFSILMTFLYNAPAGVPSAVQANVFRAVAWIPGVRVTKASDALGRPALALTAAGLNGGFLLDPRTYALIGVRDGDAAATRVVAKLVAAPGDR